MFAKQHIEPQVLKFVMYEVIILNRRSLDIFMEIIGSGSLGCLVISYVIVELERNIKSLDIIVNRFNDLIASVKI